MENSRLIKSYTSSIFGENFKSPNIKNFVYRILLMSEFRIDQSLLIWQFYSYVDFLVHSLYEFREILTVLYNWTRNFSAAERVT